MSYISFLRSMNYKYHIILQAQGEGVKSRFCDSIEIPLG